MAFPFFRGGDPIVAFPIPFTSVVGSLKTGHRQNIYDADFEYGPQALRWESFVTGGASVSHQPREGGVRITTGTAAGDIAIRQSRPYFRYQPGKALFMSTAMVFGTPVANNIQRVGFFDDGNGVFFEQDSTGMNVVIRSDVLGMPADLRIPQAQWNGNRVRFIGSSINWSLIQMLWIEYAWYGAGAIRFGIVIDGEPVVLHSHGQGNRTGAVVPWARTGNLPVRYEMRNVGAVAAPQSASHYGVSVLVEGGVDDQRGFTYSYGTARGTVRTVPSNTDRFPLMSLRMRHMGVISETNTATGGSTTTLVRTGATWTVNQWQGMYIRVTGGAGAGQIARITSNTATQLNLVDNVTGGALASAIGSGSTYQIGYPSRGQLLPRRLTVSSSARCTVELLQNPGSLTGANFEAQAALGSPSSFAERDVSATGVTLGSGEVVFTFTAPSGGSGLQDFDLSNLFPLFNNIRGTAPDVLTLAVTTPAGASADLAAHIMAQEAMS